MLAPGRSSSSACQVHQSFSHVEIYLQIGKSLFLVGYSWRAPCQQVVRINAAPAVVQANHTSLPSTAAHGLPTLALPLLLPRALSSARASCPPLAHWPREAPSSHLPKKPLAGRQSYLKNYCPQKVKVSDAKLCQYANLRLIIFILTPTCRVDLCADWKRWIRICMKPVDTISTHTIPSAGTMWIPY